MALFLFGVIASLFGPIKYGILPDHLAREELPAGNALVEGATFLAILLGTIVGGLAAKGGGDPIHFAWLMMVSALACWGASLFIPRTGEGAPNLVINRNILVSTGALLKHLRADPRLWWGALVVSWFWLVGALVLSLLPPLVKVEIGGTEDVVTVFLTIFSVAVAVGSGLAAWLAAGRIMLLPTLFGAVLLGLFALDLGWTTSRARAGDDHARARGRFRARGGIRIAIDLAGLAIAGGLFIVPTFAAVQAWAGADRRARVIAAVNVLNAAFMVVGALLVAVAPEARRRHAGAVRAHRRRQPRRRRRHRPHHAGELAARFSFDRVPRVLPARGEGPGEHRQGRPQRHHRAQPRELPRSAAGDVAAAAATRCSPSTSRWRSTGGSSRSSNSCAPWRSTRSGRWRRAP